MTLVFAQGNRDTRFRAEETMKLEIVIELLVTGRTQRFAPTVWGRA